MTATGAKLGPGTPSGVTERSPQAHLLHALNQPLTGLQCSLELALVGPRKPEQYIRTLREALELTARMRVLVEALRELADIEQELPSENEEIALDSALCEVADELRPVAESRQVTIAVENKGPLPVWGNRRQLMGLIFRFLESALSLTSPNSALQISSRREEGMAYVRVCWQPQTTLPEHSPFSRQELGLLIAGAAWKKLGADVRSERSHDFNTIIVQIPLRCDGQGISTLTILGHGI